MKYIFSVINNEVRFIGEADGESEIISQNTYPAKEYREGYQAVLDYDETEGIRWVYVAMPIEPAGVGKEWGLEKVEGNWTFVLHDRPLTASERLDMVEEEIDKQKYAWKAGETVNVDDRRFYNNKWYICIQAHTTQADWTPNVVPALWAEE